MKIALIQQHVTRNKAENITKAFMQNNKDVITQAKKDESLLRIQDKMTSLGHVAAGIAHEIRNPLSGINIFLNVSPRFYHKNHKWFFWIKGFSNLPLFTKL